MNSSYGGKIHSFYRWILSCVLIVILLTISIGEVKGEEVELFLISHRYPALEFFAKALSEPEGVKVTGSLMPMDKAYTVAVTNFAAGSSAFDITWGKTDFINLYASKGWLEPLDEYIEKYKEKYSLDKIPQGIWNAMKYEGKIYAIPVLSNVALFFYRADIFKNKGLTVPKTMEEYLDIAEKLTTEGMYGTEFALKRPTYIVDAFHYVLKAFGGEWFTKDWKPVFNSDAGIKGLSFLKKLIPYCPPDVLAYTYDEVTVGLQQNIVATAQVYASRSTPMDDPQVSKVVNLMEFAPMPCEPGGVPGKFDVDGYAICAFSKQDKDLIFRTIAHLVTRDVQMRGAEFLPLPVREDVLNDPELVKRYRHWPASLEAINMGAVTFPSIPEFSEITSIIGVPLAEALEGTLSVQEALDQASKKVYELLESRGYYK